MFSPASWRREQFRLFLLRSCRFCSMASPVRPAAFCMRGLRQVSPGFTRSTCGCPPMPRPIPKSSSALAKMPVLGRFGWQFSLFERRFPQRPAWLVRPVNQTLRSGVFTYNRVRIPMFFRAAVMCALAALPAVYGQEAAAPAAPDNTAAPQTYTIETGTRIPLALISSVSTKSSSPGDRIYLETAFPIVNGNHIVIPTGSYVTGTVTEVKRPGKIKGRGQLYVRFDSITLPNGVTREFRSRLGSVDARSGEKLDQREGQVIADSN